jgi:hypothetical protein
MKDVHEPVRGLSWISRSAARITHGNQDAAALIVKKPARETM